MSKKIKVLTLCLYFADCGTGRYFWWGKTFLDTIWSLIKCRNVWLLLAGQKYIQSREFFGFRSNLKMNKTFNFMPLFCPLWGRQVFLMGQNFARYNLEFIKDAEKCNCCWMDKSIFRVDIFLDFIQTWKYEKTFKLLKVLTLCLIFAHCGAGRYFWWGKTFLDTIWSLIKCWNVRLLLDGQKYIQSRELFGFRSNLKTGEFLALLERGEEQVKKFSVPH